MSNKEEEPKLIIISKDRILSANNKINYITLKKGDLEYKIKFSNDSLDKNGINKAVKTMKQQILINSSSYPELYNKHNINKYIKKKNNNFKINEKKLNSRENGVNKRKENIIIETTRSYDLMKATENNKDNNNDEDINKSETIIPDNNKKKNIKIKTNNKMENIKPIILKNNIINNDIKINNVEPIKLSENDNNDNNNIINDNNVLDNDNNVLYTGLITRNYFNKTNNNNKNINESNFDKYKSEEIKQLYSNSSTNKNYYNSYKNNNYIDQNNQQSDKTYKSISEQEHDNKRIFVSKLVLISDRIKNQENKKEDNNIQRLATEYVPEVQYIKDGNNDLISESKNSNEIKVEENYEYNKEGEKKTIEDKNINNNFIYINKSNNIKDINNNNNIYDNNNSNNYNEINITPENKNSFGAIVDDYDKIKMKGNNFKKVSSFFKKNLYSNIPNLCSICEHAYPETRLFVAKCQTHYLCKKCSKNYYEDIIENGIKEFLCPFKKCKQPIDLEDLKKIISKEHFNIIVKNNTNIKEKHNNYYLTKLKSNIDNENLELYTKKNVIDINSNKNFYNYYNTKGVYCPNCFVNALFSKTNTNFIKCLNCECKRCKFCLKKYDDNHIDSTNMNHCKIYYRSEDEERKDLNCCYNYLLQLFFVLACYYLCFAGTLLIFRDFFFNLFDVKRKKYIIIYLLAYLFTLILFIIAIPFVVIFYPYFPSIMAFCDY